MPPGAPPRRLPVGVDPWVLCLIAFGLALLLLPTVWDRIDTSRGSDTRGHELLLISVSTWLLYRQREAIAALTPPRSSVPGLLLTSFGLVLYVVGRSLEISLIEMASLVVVLTGLVLRYRGGAGLRLTWFPLFFLVFALPLPVELELALTAPLKVGASAVSTWFLSAIGYPVGRSGVVMTIGQYQLLVTEACAGLQTMFTLEAMGLLYASLMNHGSVLRNVLLAVLVVPVSFFANVARVTVLALITFHFGDAAGQGFLHGFAGMTVFLVALLFIMVVDGLLGRILPTRYRT